MSVLPLPPSRANRAKVYRTLAVLLMVLGVLFNLAGTAYGAVPANVGVGFILLVLGVSYWIKSGRLNRS